MKTSRRKFLSTAGLIGGSLAIQPISSCSSLKDPKIEYPDYSVLDSALKLPVIY